MSTIPPSEPTDYAPPPSSVPPDKDACLWAMLCHLAALSVWATGLGGVIGPLIIWLIKKDEHPFIDEHGKEAINFNISMLIWTAIAGVLTFCFFVTVVLIPLAFVLLPLLAVVHIVLTVVAAVKANSGEYYRYPITVRFIN